MLNPLVPQLFVDDSTHCMKYNRTYGIYCRWKLIWEFYDTLNSTNSTLLLFRIRSFFALTNFRSYKCTLQNNYILYKAIKVFFLREEMDPNLLLSMILRLAIDLGQMSVKNCRQLSRKVVIFGVESIWVKSTRDPESTPNHSIYQLFLRYKFICQRWMHHITFILYPKYRWISDGKLILNKLAYYI